MKSKSIIRFACFMFCALMLIACSSGSSSDPEGQLSFRLSDSPATDYEAVYVTIQEIQVYTEATDSENEDGEWTVISAPQKTCSLLSLINGNTADLGIGSLAVGDYTQIRLVLGQTADGEKNLLDEDHPFANYIVKEENGELKYYELKIPSGDESGIVLAHGFSVLTTAVTEILFDFDVSRSIVMAGTSGNWILSSVVKVLTVAESGIIKGAVTDNTDSQGAEQVLVSVQKKSPSEGEEQVVSSTVTDASGEYQITVPPGDYAVVVTKDGYASQVADVTVTSGETSVLDFAVDAAEADGTVEGDVTVDGGNDESHVTLVFKQLFENNDGQLTVEIASLNIGEGGSYSLNLPIGFYSVVAIAENGEEQDKGTIEITAEININISIVFTIVIDDDSGDDTDGEKVQVCHNGMTLSISAEDLQDHLDHGDTEGSCESTDGDTDDGDDSDDGDDTGSDDDGETDDCTGKVVVCHNGHAIEISCSALDAHLAHGDTLGECPDSSDDSDSSDDDGSSDDGSADDGSSDDGSADDGSSDDGSADDGSSDDGSADDGSSDDGSADDGSSDDGSADDGSSDDGSADDGSSDDGSADDTSDTNA